MKERVVTFQGHHNYIVSIAKLCKENCLFTDVVILCDDGKLVAHKIVLAAVSPFLRHVLDTDSSSVSSGQTTIVMPDVRKDIVQQLLDFLYTGVMKLSPSATWELQQLVLLLQIDPQNVGVDAICSDSTGKIEPTSPGSVVQTTLGVKIAHKADISKPSLSSSPLQKAPSVSHISRSASKGVKSPSRVNGIKESPKTSPRDAPPTSESVTLTPKLKISELNSTKLKFSEATHPKLKISEIVPSSKPKNLDTQNNGNKTKIQESTGIKLKSSENSTATKVKPQDATPSKIKNHENKQNKPKSEKSLNPMKISISSGSIIRSAEPVKPVNRVDEYNFSLSMNSNSNPISSKEKISTRKRPLSEKIDYKEMIADEETSTIKKSRGGKSRAKSGGVKAGGKKRNEEVVCAICNQFDPSIPSHYKLPGNKTEWIGCDCNRWFHKFCTGLKEVDDSFSCRLVHKTCLQSPQLS